MADVGVFGEASCVFVDGEIGRAAVSNLQDGSPLGEPASQCVEISSHRRKCLNSFGEVLLLSVAKNTKSLINLDTSHDAQRPGVFHEVDPM